jgi:hypothetical protein
MNKTSVLETIDFYMKQVMDLVKRGKSIDPISVIEALRYIENDVRQLR